MKPYILLPLRIIAAAAQHAVQMMFAWIGNLWAGAVQFGHER
jgi:hypothetical protein